MSNTHKIEYCTNNLAYKSQKSAEWIQIHYPDIETAQYTCIGYCDRCTKVPFVLIDDEHYLEAQNVSALWLLIQKYFEKK